jgi:hypothetical protein
MSNTITLINANAIADQLVELAEQISDFRFKHFDTLSTEDSANLRLLVSSIRRTASDITALIIGQKIQDLQDNLKVIAEAANEAEKAIAKITEIREAIDIATAIVRLGSAVITLNPDAILEAANNLIAVSK